MFSGISLKYNKETKNIIYFSRNMYNNKIFDKMKSLNT